MATNKETSIGIRLVTDIRNYQTNLKKGQTETKKFGKNVKREIGDVKASFQQLMRGDLTALPGFFKAATASAGGFANGLKGVKAALIATGVGALLVALGAAVASITQYFKGTEEGQIVFMKVMNNVKAYTEPVLQMFGSFGKALVHLFKGEFGEAWETAKGAIKGVDDQIKKNKDSLEELNTLEEKLIKSRRQAASDEKRLMAEISELRNKAKDTENYTAVQNLKFADMAIAKQKELAAVKNTLAADELRIAELKASFGDNDIATNNQLQELADQRLIIQKQEADGLREIMESRRTIAKLAAQEIDLQATIARQIAERAANQGISTLTTRTEFSLGEMPQPDTSKLDNMGNYMDANAAKTARFREELYKLNDTQIAVVDSIANGFAWMGESIVQSLGLADTGFQGFVKGMANTIIQLVSQMLAASMAQSISGATAAGAATGPLSVVTTPAFIATAISGVLAAFAAIPKLASGGVAYGDSLVRVGEYSNARVNPEVIAPLDKLKGMVSQNSSGVEILQPRVDFDGEKLYFVMDRIGKRIKKRT